MLDLSTCHLVVKVGPLLSENHGGDGSSREKNQADAVSTISSVEKRLIIFSMFWLLAGLGNWSEYIATYATDQFINRYYDNEDVTCEIKYNNTYVVTGYVERLRHHQRHPLPLPLQKSVGGQRGRHPDPFDKPGVNRLLWGHRNSSFRRISSRAETEDVDGEPELVRPRSVSF